MQRSTTFFYPYFGGFSPTALTAPCARESVEKPWGRFGIGGLSPPAVTFVELHPGNPGNTSLHRDVNQTSLAGTLVSAKLRQNQRLERVERTVDRPTLGRLRPADGRGVEPQVGPRYSWGWVSRARRRPFLYRGHGVWESYRPDAAWVGFLLGKRCLFGYKAGIEADEASVGHRTHRSVHPS